MKIWLDEHLSPLMASWIAQRFGFETAHVRELHLERARDHDIFVAARSADAVLITKDADFVALLERMGPPPRLIWLTCGNMPNAGLKRLLDSNLRQAIEALESGEPMAEVS